MDRFYFDVLAEKEPSKISPTSLKRDLLNAVVVFFFFGK